MLLFGYKSILLFGNNQFFLKEFLIFFLARYVFIASVFDNTCKS